MAKDPGFIFYPGDYLRDTQCLSEKAQVAYDRMLCEHMRNECVSQKQLDFFTKRMSEEEKEDLLFILKQVDGGYQIEWVAESIAKRKAHSAKQKENAEKRWQSQSKAKNKNINAVASNGIDLAMPLENENENENEIIIENEKGGMGEKTELWPTFEDFWDAYDKKVGNRAKIALKFKKVPQDQKEKIMHYIEAYKAQTPDKQFRKNPETFLNNKSWHDEIIPTRKQVTSNQVGEYSELLREAERTLRPD